MEEHRYVEALPVLMLDYHQHYRGNGFSKVRKISFADYHQHLIPESLRHSTRDMVYTPDEARSFTLAMRLGLVSNAALEAYGARQMRASGWGKV